MGSIFCAYFNLEIYNQIYIYDEDRNAVKPTMFDKEHWIMFAIAAIFLLLKPLTMARVIRNHRKGAYFMVKIFTDYMIVMIASTFTEPIPALATN